MDAKKLKDAMSIPMERAQKWAPPLTKAMTQWNINTPLRMAAFIAQAGHESGQFRYVRELGGDQYLSKYDTGALAKRLGNTPEADGDGQKYCGRGLIQITGRANYAQAAKALGLPLLDQPELLEQPEWAAISAAWWWSAHGLNELADAGKFEAITRKINGGINGLADREALYAKALKVLV